MFDVAENLSRINDRIAEACARAGRDSETVKLIAVTKRIPMPLLVEARRAGQLVFGENRIQDALPRQGDLATVLLGTDVEKPPVEWHFIGNLQSNKARKAVGRFELLHAVDSIRLAERLSVIALELGISQPILLEVNASEEEQKHGLMPEETPMAVDHVAGLPGLDLRGFMGMARFGASEIELRSTFAALRGLSEAARRATGLPLPELSMGMSGDFECAIAEGATLVRVGTAVFGPRDPLN